MQCQGEIENTYPAGDRTAYEAVTLHHIGGKIKLKYNSRWNNILDLVALINVTTNFLVVKHGFLQGRNTGIRYLKTGCCCEYWDPKGMRTWNGEHFRMKKYLSLYRSPNTFRMKKIWNLVRPCSWVRKCFECFEIFNK